MKSIAVLAEALYREEVARARAMSPEVVKSLEALQSGASEYFFWDGKSERETTVTT